jgi:hypothetical protein
MDLNQGSIFFEAVYDVLRCHLAFMSASAGYPRFWRSSLSLLRGWSLEPR